MLHHQLDLWPSLLGEVALNRKRGFASKASSLPISAENQRRKRPKRLARPRYRQ